MRAQFIKEMTELKQTQRDEKLQELADLKKELDIEQVLVNEN